MEVRDLPDERLFSIYRPLSFHCILGKVSSLPLLVVRLDRS